ncbi:MAG: MarR family transcriptional regulator [Ilumatobacteraceae bacterium]
MSRKRPTQSDYERLLEFRTTLRRFLHWSDEQAERAGLTPAQHQLLLAIRGHSETEAPSIGDIAESLLVRHHSVGGLIDRAEASGLVSRRRDDIDGRIVRVELTHLGSDRLAKLTASHLTEIAQLAGVLAELDLSLGGDASAGVST